MHVVGRTRLPRRGGTDPKDGDEVVGVDEVVAAAAAAATVVIVVAVVALGVGAR